MNIREKWQRNILILKQNQNDSDFWVRTHFHIAAFVHERKIFSNHSFLLFIHHIIFMLYGQLTMDNVLKKKNYFHYSDNELIWSKFKKMKRMTLFETITCFILRTAVSLFITFKRIKKKKQKLLNYLFVLHMKIGNVSKDRIKQVFDAQQIESIWIKDFIIFSYKKKQKSTDCKMSFWKWGENSKANEKNRVSIHDEAVVLLDVLCFNKNKTFIVLMRPTKWYRISPDRPMPILN